MPSLQERREGWQDESSDKALVAKPDDLSLVPGTLMVEREQSLLKGVVSPPCLLHMQGVACLCSGEHTCTRMTHVHVCARMHAQMSK